MMCEKHNRYYRVGECELCIRDRRLCVLEDRIIQEAEEELKTTIVLWEGANYE